MSILHRLMNNMKYKLVKVEREQTYIRKVTFINSKKEEVLIIVDERELEGVSDIIDLAYHYRSLINKAIKNKPRD